VRANRTGPVGGRAQDVDRLCGGQQQGTLALTAVDANRIQGTISWVRREAGGERKTTVQVDSRWLSADCGAVKPGAPQQVKG